MARSGQPGRRDGVHDGADAHECGDAGENLAAHPHRGVLARDRRSQPGLEQRGSSAHASEVAGQHAGVNAPVTGATPGGAGCECKLESGERTKTDSCSTSLEGVPLPPTTR